MGVVDPHFTSLAGVLTRTDQRLRDPLSAAILWPTGFDVLDDVLGGGLRAGNLILLAGAQGLGKTTFCLQVARGAARAGREVVYFCFEHDPGELLERLIALEMGEVNEYEAPDVATVRAAVEGRSGEAGQSLAERLAGHVGGVEALSRISEYSDRLHLHRSSGSSTTLDVMASVVDEVSRRSGHPPLVVLDYLQKVRVPGGLPEDERVTDTVERLKDLAMDVGTPVLAVTAADKEGLESGRRMRARDLRGSTALAYEADVVLVMADKFDVVARQHLVYDLSNVERFHEWVVISLEKNRNGRDDVDVEFRKVFHQSRFDPTGRRVSEKLLDERVYTE